MAGSCDAYVRSTGSTAVLYIPYKFWGLKFGETYRAIMTLHKLPPDQIPYSFDVVPCKVGASARISIPKCIKGVEVGDMVHICIGRPEDYKDERGWAAGRGITQTERTAYLEEQTNLLRRCAGKQIHN